MLISYTYVCTCEICFWTYIPTCRNKCNWCTLKHLVLVKIKGLKELPKIPGNTFSDALLKSRFPNFAADAAKKNRTSRGFFWRESRQKMMHTFNDFFQECQERCMYCREAGGCLPFFPSPWYKSFWNPPHPSMYHAVELLLYSGHSLHWLVVFVYWWQLNWFQAPVTRSWCLRTSSSEDPRLIAFYTPLFHVDFQSV